MKLQNRIRILKEKNIKYKKGCGKGGLKVIQNW